MKFYKYFLGIVTIFTFALATQFVHAALTPTLLVSPNSDSTVQVTILGADPNVSALLYYPTSSGFSTAILGTTNSGGTLSTSVNPSTYSITPGSMVYAFTNGMQSQQIAWPNITNTTSGTFALNVSNIIVTAGQNTTITGLNGSNVSISSNTNPSIAGANINGNQITLSGYTPGVTNITFCSLGNGCATEYVTVQPSSSSGTVTSQTLTLSQTNVDLSIGQTQVVTITGPGSYVISNNTSPGTVIATLVNNNLNLVGQAFGSANVTVCLSSNAQCSSVYVYVAPGNPGNVVAPSLPTVAPVLTSFSLSSNNLNNAFSGAGDLLTIQFSTNQAVVNPSATIAGTRITLTGSGAGPYIGTYPVTGSETQPLQLAITFTNSANMTGQVNMALSTQVGSGYGLTVVPQGTTITTPISTPTVTPTSSGVVFTNYLKPGSTGTEVSALQTRLTQDGIYSGPITGTYGALTEAAVERYQTKHNIDSLGVVGPATRGLLNQGL